ncbi:MAG: DUF3102 domain-containing protein [Burkholderiales bacterium]
MVAKNRTRCSTCGKPFEQPRRWAYCSKRCEKDRRARPDPQDLDLPDVVDERLRLRVALESASPGERAALLRMLAQNEQREVAMRDALAEIGAPRDSVRFWLPSLREEADHFELTMRRSLASAIRLGRRLLEAKAHVPHGEFCRLFRDHQDAVVGALPFTRHWAHRLMTIGANEAVANVEHAQHLPSDIETVYLLARLPAEVLQAAIEREQVTTDMGRGEARAMVAPTEKPAPHDMVGAAIEQVARVCRRLMESRPGKFPEFSARVRSVLRGLLRERRARA